MVNQDIVNYLQEGKKRGFAVSLLKQKLLGGGFSEAEINEAINFTNGSYGPQKIANQFSQPSVARPSVIQQTNAPPTLKPPITSPIAAPPQVHPSLPQNNFGNSSRPIVTNNVVVKSKGKWMKVAGIIGFLFFGIAIISLISFFAPSVLVIISNGYANIAVAIFGLILFSFYYAGFIRMGKRIDSKLIKFGAWGKLVSMYALIVYAVVLFFVVWSVLSALFLTQQPLSPIGGFATFDSVGGVSDLGGLGATSGILTGMTLTMTIILGGICLLYLISQVILAIGLVKAKGKVRFAKAAGIFNILIALFATSAIIIFAVSYIKILAALLMLALVGAGQIPTEAYLFFGLAGVSYLCLLLADLFESLALLDASKKFE